MILGSDGEKMSKSRGNVVNPDDIVSEYGADALRLYEMFMGPLEAVKPWQTNQLIGVVRFRDKVYNLVNTFIHNNNNKNNNNEPIDDELKEMHKTIKKVTKDIDVLNFNTAIASLIIFVNFLTSLKTPPSKKAIENLVLMLSPFAPHVAEECWQLLGNNESLAYQAWPTFDEQYCIENIITIAIQVNGKVRSKLEVDKDIDEKDLLSNALTQQNVAKFIDGSTIKKTIYVRGKILNILV